MPKFVLAWITSTSEGNQSMQSRGHVVFVRHPERGWEIPGGHLNVGESPENALIREVKEETGIKNLSIIKPLDKTYHIFKRGGKNYLKSTYWFEMKSDFIGKFKPQKKEGITRVEWIGIENLSSILPKSYANIRLLIG